MQTSEILFLITSSVVSYLFGSIPWALIIGKLFFNKDIRQYGSKNLGGTNAGRVLGAKAGVSVMALDILKVVFAGLFITYLLVPLFNLAITKTTSESIYISLLFGVLGHCYPLFASFRGGKAVSVAVGFLLFTNPFLVLVFAVSFFSLLKLTKIVSLSSMTSMVLTSIVSFIPFIFTIMLHNLKPSLYFNLAIILITILLIFRHRENVKRIINKNERKITWM
ncbi:TPA: glycerol-3-phosphate 1-O-acyltransferase PlsY [bacterium]|nr:glycerol-3-phosphate 1-O-acyltransferase PlsY [bacterium]